MKVTIHQWDGVVVDVYQFEKGEKLPRHSHPWIHSTAVVKGKTKVTLFENTGWEDDWTMAPGDPDYAFVSELEHEIEALEDDTIIMNMRTAGSPGQAGADGGITFDDT